MGTGNSPAGRFGAAGPLLAWRPYSTAAPASVAHETRGRALSNPFHSAWPAPATRPAESRDTEMSILRRVRGRAGPVLVVAVLAVVALLVVGCGADGDSPGVATASNSSDQPSPTTTTMADQEQQALQFTKCMRENGVGMPDPTVDTDGNLRWQPPDMSGSSQAELQKARDACQQYLQGVCCIERSEVILREILLPEALRNASSQC
jgi:hypothetical protein